MTICIKRVKSNDGSGDYLWRAYLKDKKHIGGMGDNPGEAVGHCIMNASGPDGSLNDNAVTSIEWLSKKPKGYNQ